MVRSSQGSCSHGGGGGGSSLVRESRWQPCCSRAVGTGRARSRLARLLLLAVGRAGQGISEGGEARVTAGHAELRSV